jgi:hypothetical protein
MSNVISLCRPGGEIVNILIRRETLHSQRCLEKAVLPVVRCGARIRR